jgi:hypothetical protein
MTVPDDIPLDGDDEDLDFDPSGITAARESEANEADLIEQAYAVPSGDDERGFER